MLSSAKKIQKVRDKRKKRTRSKVAGSAGRPRLAVFRSARHIYVQAVDDEAGRTMAEASTRSKELVEAIAKMKKTAAAAEVGKLMAKKLLAMNIDSVIYDRGRFLYHGRVKALADGAREAGLKF
ncbi:MAG TPA: 50S ribosomal protein L18 [Syntrophales bacterium]|nr:50S ribosomal protein L18 [Syntrophales bacterium]